MSFSQLKATFSALRPPVLLKLQNVCSSFSDKKAMTSLVDQICNEIEILQINKNGLRARWPRVKIDSHLRRWSSVVWKDGRGSFETFGRQSRVKVLAFVCYLCEKQIMCLLFMTNTTSPRSNISNVLSPFGFENSQSVILTRHSI